MKWIMIECGLHEIHGKIIVLVLILDLTVPLGS